MKEAKNQKMTKSIIVIVAAAFLYLVGTAAVLAFTSQETFADWTVLHEGFEEDFISDDTFNFNRWQYEGRAYLSVVHDANHLSWVPDGGTGYLKVDFTAATADGTYSIIKQNEIQGGALSQVSTQFWMNYIGTETGTQMSIIAFRNADFTGVGFVRIINTSAATYNLVLRANSTNSGEAIQLSKNQWYKVTFAYDATSDPELNLSVEGHGAFGFGSTLNDTIQYIHYGKTASSGIEGELQLDNVSILAPEISDLWVDRVNGSDENDGLSAQNALRHIQTAVDRAGPGTTVHVKPGTYNERVSMNYRGLNPFEHYLTLQGEGDTADEVVIDGTGISHIGSWMGLVEIQNTSYVRLSNLKIYNSASFGIYISESDHVDIGSIETEITQMSGIYAASSSNMAVHDNEIDRACQIDLFDGETRILAQEIITMKTVSLFSIYNNEIHGGAGLPNGGEGISVKGYSDHGLIYNNHVYDLPDDVGIYLNVGSQTSIDGVGVSTHDIRVYNNEVNTDIGIGVSSEGNSTSDDGGIIEDVDIFNNIVHSGKYAGITVTKWRSEAGPGVVGLRRGINIFNNTIYGMGQQETVGAGIHIQCDHPDHIEDIVITNNISAENGAGQLVVPPEVYSKVTMSHNLLFGDPWDQNEIAPGSEQCLDCIGTDPDFFNAPGADFSLLSTSPAIDAATPVEVDLDFTGSPQLLSFDYVGNIRPGRDSAGFDIGAYEYQLFNGDPTWGSAPLNVRFAANSAKTMTQWAWDFDNDGNVDSTAENPQYVYTVAGDYSVTLHISDGTNTDVITRTDYITVTKPVVADFTSDVTQGVAPLKVSFFDKSAGDIVSWVWVIEKNVFSTDEAKDYFKIELTDQNPVYEFVDPGLYTVSLTVTDGMTSDTKTVRGYIRVTLPPVPEPKIDFVAVPTSGACPLRVQFTDLSDLAEGRNMIHRLWYWYWDFDGDGKFDSKEHNPIYIYRKPGVYSVTLVVSDGVKRYAAIKKDYIKVNDCFSDSESAR